MPKVLCTLPNAAETIVGLGGAEFQFVSHVAGMLSQEMTAEEADHFLLTPGFELHGSTGGAADTEQDEREDLLKRAAAIGFSVKQNWGLPRLRTEVEQAEAAAKQ